MPIRVPTRLRAKLVICTLLAGVPAGVSAHQSHYVSAQARKEVSERKAAVFSGAVTDSASKPIVGAEVSIPSLGLSAKADAEGRFRIAEIPAGIHRVVARAVGYVAVTASLVFVDGEIETRRFILERVSVLDSVNVAGKVRNTNETDFDVRRRSGIGTFYTREQLAKFDERALSRLLPQLPGARIIRSRDNREVLASSRHAGTLRGPSRPCYAKIYVDNVVRYGGTPNEPLFDMSSVPINQIESVEYYAGAAQSPARYGGLEAGCGVMVIWMRRGRA